MLLTSRTTLSFYFNDPAPTEIYTLSLHDALPISAALGGLAAGGRRAAGRAGGRPARAGGARVTRARRSEEHTSELQSRSDLVCRLLLEKKKKGQYSWSLKYGRSPLPEFI